MEGSDVRVGYICTQFEYLMTRREGDPHPLRSTIWLAQDPTCPRWRQNGSCWFENLDYGSRATWHGDNIIGMLPTLNLHMVFDYRGGDGVRQRNTHGVENKWARVHKQSSSVTQGYFRGTDYLNRIIELWEGPSYVLTVNQETGANEWIETDTSIFTMDRPTITQTDINFALRQWNRSHAAKGGCAVYDIRTRLD